MSLSDTCQKQHEKEYSATKKWLMRGLVVAVGTHLGLIPLMALIPADVDEPPERIALVVTGPVEQPEMPIEEIPPEESVEALTEAVAQTELAAEAQISGGVSAPPPVASSLPEPQLSSDSIKPLEPIEEVPETLVETEAVPLDSPSLSTESEVSETETNAAPDIDALRARLARARRGAENGSPTGREEVPAEPSGRGAETVRRTGPPNGSGAGTGAGNGNGDSSGPTTVSCRRCDRPEYPEEALEEGIEGSPAVSLRYDENGKVIGAVLEQSSGNAALDRAALEAARNYEMNSGGRSGSVSIEIDFGIEGSRRSRAARRRGEREAVTRPAPQPAAPEREIVQERAPEPTPSPVETVTTEPIAAPEPSVPDPSVPEPSAPEPSAPEPSAPAAPESMESPASEPVSVPENSVSPSVPATAPPPEPVTPPPVPVAPPEPVSQPIAPVAPLPEATSTPDSSPQE